MRMLRVLAITVLLTSNACTYLSGDPTVLVSSEPAGAEIFVDGASTGQTTPSKIELGGLFGGNHDITVRMAGREPETREVRHHRNYETSSWNNGADTELLGLTLPFWWTFGDFLLPFAVKWRYTPHEVHVRLYEEGEGPVRTVTGG